MESAQVPPLWNDSVASEDRHFRNRAESHEKVKGDYKLFGRLGVPLLQWLLLSSIMRPSWDWACWRGTCDMTQFTESPRLWNRWLVQNTTRVARLLSQGHITPNVKVRSSWMGSGKWTIAGRDCLGFISMWENITWWKMFGRLIRERERD